MSQPSVTMHDKFGLEIGLAQWLKLQQDDTYRVVADTTTFYGSLRIVTVWTGISYQPHRPDEGTIFESRVYRGYARQTYFPTGAPRLTWPTLDEAIAGHWRAVTWLRWHVRTEQEAARRALVGL